MNLEGECDFLADPSYRYFFIRRRCACLTHHECNAVSERIDDESKHHYDNWQKAFNPQ